MSTRKNNHRIVTVIRSAAIAIIALLLVGCDEDEDFRNPYDKNYENLANPFNLEYMGWFSRRSRDYVPYQHGFDYNSYDEFIDDYFDFYDYYYRSDYYSHARVAIDDLGESHLDDIGYRQGGGGVRLDEINLDLRRAAAVLAQDDFVTVYADLASGLSSGNVFDNDANAADGVLLATIEAVAANGVVQLDSDGSFLYIPDPGFSGEDSFEYRATAFPFYNSATVFVTVVATDVHSLDLKSGWNLVSLTSISQELQLSTALASEISAALVDDEIQEWNAETQEFRKVEAAELRAGVGYWMYANHDAMITYNVLSDEIQEAPVLQPSWNLSGIVGLVDHAVLNSVFSPRSVVSFSDGQYHRLDSRRLKPSCGYWVYYLAGAGETTPLTN
jgi:hypothetical protein